MVNAIQPEEKRRGGVTVTRQSVSAGDSARRRPATTVEAVGPILDSGGQAGTTGSGLRGCCTEVDGEESRSSAQVRSSLFPWWLWWRVCECRGGDEMMLIVVCGVLGRSGAGVGRVAAAVCGGVNVEMLGCDGGSWIMPVVVTGKVWWCLAWGEWHRGCGGGTGSQGSTKVIKLAGEGGQ
ncbi:proline-rich receptor-like protein kinase PERK2 [Iris pallida]|uniref:Proline-rich receptor-like protein kinase PERK2 n=1 Tax=Iris pallida TaxID=29817 RepID=A0AAX6HHD7_IRIPA|nr:proline-rich receptor-like protein kinase PERK2 [Iris pallida]